MKLKYTLVFTIISFFISTAGFAQQYTDQEIGLNVSKITASLKERGATEANITFEISLLRRMHTNQYAKIKQNESETLKETKSKVFVNKSVLATDISSTEKSVLQTLYNSTNGDNWINKQGWDFSTPVTSWDGTNGWYGITVTNGTITSINLSQNNLVGSLPPEIENLPNLKYLYLAENELNGIIPTEIGNLSNLIHLSLSFNKLSGSIPSSLGNLNNVEFLFLGNNQLTGSIPVEIGNLPKVTNLYLYHNQLSSSIPIEICYLPKLEALFLEYNNLSGSIPNEISNLSKLKFFNLSNNQLTGTIPTGIGSLYYNLLEVYFSNNQLTGTIPSQILLYNLSSLYLDNNKLSGTIPSNINQLRNIGLLYLDHNQLTGTIPTTIGNLPEAIHVNLSNNQLTGTIPVEIGGLPKVQMLDLSFNQLAGSIPSEIGNLTYIRNLLLNNNQFSGVIPSKISQLPLIGNFYINNNKFRFIDFANEYQTYKSKLWEFKYSNQAILDSKETINANILSSVTLTMCTDNRYTSNDTYQWYKGQYPNGELIPGATNRQQILSNIKLSDAGEYYCLSSHPQITNPANPDQNLVLQRESLFLNVVCNSSVIGHVMPSSHEFTINQAVNFYFDSSSTNLYYDWTFYDSDDTVLKTATTNNVNLSYNKPGVYKIHLIVTDENGCKTTFDNSAIVYSGSACLGEFNGVIIPPRQDLYNGVLSGNLYGDIYGDLYSFFINTPYNIRFENMDFTSEIISYDWSLVNSNGELITTANTANFPITATIPGDYKVTLILRHQNNNPSPWKQCSYFETILKARDPNLCVVSPEERFNYKYSIINADYSNSVVINKDVVLALENTEWITPERFSFKWALYNNEGTQIKSGTEQNFSIKLTDIQQYTVNLEIKDLLGCVTNYTRKIIPSDVTNCTIGEIKMTYYGKLVLHSGATFSLQTLENNLNFKWTFYNPDGTESVYYGNSTYYPFQNGIGDYKVSLEITNGDGCVTIFEKIFNVVYDCDNDKLYGEIQNMNTPDPLSSLVLINNQTAFQFYSYNDDLQGKTFSWELINSSGSIIKTGNEQELNITLSELGHYILKIKITSPEYNCVSEFSKEIQVVDLCDYSNDERLGEISLEDELISYRAGFIDINQTKNLNFQLYNQNETKTYSYHWKVYSPDNILLTSGTQKTFPLTLVTGGFHKITIDVEDLETGCTTQISRNINCLISNSCTFTNSKSETVKDLFFNLLKNLISRSAMGETDEQINASIATSEFIKLKPYITNGLKDKIYNFKSTTKINEWNNQLVLSAVDFSFSPDRTSDVHVYFPLEVSYNPQYDTYESLLERIEEVTYLDISQYKSANEPLISCYVYPLQKMGGKTTVKPSPNDCDKEIIVQYVNFCPDDCQIVNGTIKSSTENIMTNTDVTYSLETTATNLSYKWTFQKGALVTTFTAPSVIYSYHTAGDYNINLVVTDTNGCTATFEKTVTVTEKPACVAIVGEIKTANPIISTNENTTFSFETTATNLRYNWTFHSLNNTPLLTTSDSNPTLMYPYANNYKVTLIVMDENDCPTTFEKTVTVVKGCPVIAGSVNIPETVITGQIIPFEYNTSYTGMGYKWTFYNLDNSPRSNSTASKINTAYYTPGNYRVTLELSDLFNYGCNTFIDKIVKVTGECNISGTIESNPGDAGITLDQYVYFRFESDAINVKYKWTVTTPDNVSTVYSTDKYAPYYFQSGSGTYKIAVEVSDSNSCTFNLEKTYNLQYDCSRNTGLVTGSIYNNNHKFYYSSDVLIDAPNKFTFWHNNSNNENLPVSWELTDLNGALISSGIEKEFIFTPTTSAGLILKLTITDQYGCPHYFSKELNVVGKCQFYVSDISGDINFDEEYSYKVAFIDANQTKDLIFRSYDENDGKVYTYQWNLYDLDDTLISSGSQQKFPITLTKAGYYKVTLDIIDPDTDCPIQFTKKIGCVIYNSCTENNPKSQIVKDLFLNLIRSLIIRSSIGETDEQINNSEATPEFIALKPYITNGPKDKIYNFKSKLGGESGNSLEGFEFSFSPERQSDVYYHTRWSIFFNPWDVENSTDRINQTLYLALNQYVSADQSLVSCYVDYGGKMAGKNVNRLEEEDCVHQLAVQYIDFCPAEDCTPITGTLKSTPVLGAQTGEKKIQQKPASRK